jgi:O-antigen/teichoic acid export membrane protein
MKSSTALDVILSGLKILVLILMLGMGYMYAPYIAFLFSFLILDLILLLLNIKNSFKDIQFGKVVKTFKTLFIYSLPILLSESLSDLGMGLDRLFLAKFYTTFASGIYDVTITLCLGYILISNAYANALLPIASRDRKNSNKLKKDLLKTSWYVLIFYVAYTLAVLLLAQHIITIVNPSYLPAIEFLKPLMIVYALIGFLSLFSYFVNAINLQKYALLASILFALNSFMLNFYFVPQLKYLGAVNAILISAIVSVTLLAALIWRRLKLKK